MSTRTIRDYLKPVGFKARDSAPGEPVDVHSVSPERYYRSRMRGFSELPTNQPPSKVNQPRKRTCTEELEMQRDTEETRARTILPWVIGLDPTLAPYLFLLEKITSRRGLSYF